MPRARGRLQECHAPLLQSGSNHGHGWSAMCGEMLVLLENIHTNELSLLLFWYSCSYSRVLLHIASPLPTHSYPSGGSSMPSPGHMGAGGHMAAPSNTGRIVEVKPPSNPRSRAVGTNCRCQLNNALLGELSLILPPIWLSIGQQSESSFQALRAGTQRPNIGGLKVRYTEKLWGALHVTKLIRVYTFRGSYCIAPS
jgi:hypothetical protein